MIIKSMSRKAPSFGQLLAYIDREAGQEAFTLRQNLYGRDHASIRAEFEENARLLQKRKNGVYLFHEILSLTRAKALSSEEQKARLYEITQEYIKARCPGNLVYGGLHQDKDHSFHMHLMISANRTGEEKRQRLTKQQFREIQVQLEAHVLRTYPELEQKLAIGKRSEKGRSQAGEELERRTGRRPQKEEILDRLRRAHEASTDRDSLISSLREAGFDLYTRGKTIGVVDLGAGKRHRLKTLDPQIASEIEQRLSQQQIDTKHEEERSSKQEDTMEREREGREPTPPSPERQELIDKGHVKPDPERDLMSHKEWKDQDRGLTKVQQSWRRTMDDFRGRTKDLENRARGEGDDDQRDR